MKVGEKKEQGKEKGKRKRFKEHLVLETRDGTDGRVEKDEQRQRPKETNGKEMSEGKRRKRNIG